MTQHRALLQILFFCLSADFPTASRVQRRATKRTTLIRDIPVIKEQLTPECTNTLSGRWLVTDSNGVLCNRDGLVPGTQCCGQGESYSCKSCNLENQCCSEYEMCVSCCMKPEHRAKELMQTQYRAADRQESGRWNTSFDYCRGKCRSSSRSTVHENAYLSPLHHCFSLSGKPTVPSPPVPDVPAGTRILLSAVGQSCKEKCQEEGLVCNADHFPSLNDCNRLRESFACEAGCEAGDGHDLPAYVTPTAPKPQRPSICLTWSQELTGGSMTCEGVGVVRQRACPCVRTVG